MKQLPRVLAATIVALAAARASATPSTTFWTPATTYTQPYLVPHLTYDTYVAEQGMLANDYGLTMGILPFEKLQAEIGFDVFYPGYTQNGFYLNGKVTLPEGAYASWQPGVSLGIQSVGFRSDINDYNHLHLTIGKTFAGVGSFAVGAYHGLTKSLYQLPTETKAEQTGFMASYVSPDIKVGLPGLDKIVLVGDYASGKNYFGGGGVGASLYFTPAISLLTGPVWFPKGAAATDFMWTFQLDVDVELLKK